MRLSKRRTPPVCRLPPPGRPSERLNFHAMIIPEKKSIIEFNDYVGSNRPTYPWLFTSLTDYAALPAKIRVQREFGQKWQPAVQHTAAK